MKRYLNGLMVLLVFTTLSNVASAAHWTSPAQVSRAAHQVSNAAERFHRVIEYMSGFSHFAGDVHRLSENAEHFHQAVERGASYNHVLNDYYQMKRQLQHVRRQMYRVHNIHHFWNVQRAFRSLESAFYRLQYEMGDNSHGGGHGGGHGFGHGF